MNEWPNPLNGKNPVCDWLNRLRQRCMQGEIVQIVGGAIEEKGDKGRIASTSTAVGGGANGHFRGEYIKTETYLIDDEVVRMSGVNMGCYTCVRNNPPATIPPWVGGGYWVRKSGGALGRWL